MTRKRLSPPPLAFLNECLDYNPESGILTWRHRPSHHFKKAYVYKYCNSKFSGKEAGSKCQTGTYVTINRVRYMASSLIYFMYYGYNDHKQILHINNDIYDNKIENLSYSRKRCQDVEIPEQIIDNRLTMKDAIKLI